jgi:hypothetical protein
LWTWRLSLRREVTSWFPGSSRRILMQSAYRLRSRREFWRRLVRISTRIPTALTASSMSFLKSFQEIAGLVICSFQDHHHHHLPRHFQFIIDPNRFTMQRYVAWRRWNHDISEEHSANLLQLFTFSLGGVRFHLVRRWLFCLLYQPRMMNDERGAIHGMLGRETQSTLRKPAPLPLRPPQIPHDLTWLRTLVAVVGIWRLTARTTVRPNSLT